MLRFRFLHRMQMALADGKYFRAGLGRLKRVALTFLDNSSRKALYAVVGTSESARLMLGGVYRLTREYGLMDAMYLDGGPGFIADVTRQVCEVRLQIPIIIGTAHYPEGHGAIERLNQTLQNDLLRSLARPDVDPSTEHLTMLLQHYLYTQYNERPHESLGGRSPNEVWNADERPLKFVSSDEQLRERFIITERHRVSADNIIKVDGQQYEAPIGYARRNIDVRRYFLDDVVAIIHENKVLPLHLVDQHANATQHRQGRSRRDTRQLPPLVPTAAEAAFHRDFGGIVGDDGALLRKPEKRQP
jgi:hypothetical protein